MLPRPDWSKGGRRSFDRLPRFEILVLQSRKSLEEPPEFALRARLIWMWCLDVGLRDRFVPTIGARAATTVSLADPIHSRHCMIGLQRQPALA